MKKAIFPFLIFSSMVGMAQRHQYMLVGTYTSPKSQGIYVYDFNRQDGSAVLVDSVQTQNASYLALSPDNRFVYAVSELGQKAGGGKLRSYAFDRSTGKLRFINEQSSKGADPCYVSVDRTGKWLAVANYSSGSLAVLPISADGSLGEASSFREHQGKGPNARRQEAPHVHTTVFSPDNKYLLATDLGTDKLMVYPFNAQTGALGVPKEIQMDPGSGPRHLEFHPTKSWVYVLNELSGKINAYLYGDGNLLQFQSVSALPRGFNQSFTSADIHVSGDGKYLYASNRDSSNTIGVFAIDKLGKLNAKGFTSTLGRTPRNFSLDPSGKYMLVANQNSDEIVVFIVDKAAGTLSDLGKRISIGRPVCIKWADKR